ncbi:MAG: SDR family oxidoreductase [Patescibacteria group bacterium]|nr:SDR family oxidoreductase [Patescibacteria group bacterium]
MRKRYKKILVTGGAGFIGSHLCEYLLQKGHQIICLDDFSTGSKRNIEHLLENKNFTLVEHDVVLPYFCRVDEIYNLACPASPVHYQQDSIKTLKTNILGAINMLDLALHTKAKILQASTSEIYGDPLIHPQKESYWGHVNPIGKRSCYDEGKRCAETLFMDYRRQYRVSIKIVRIFNTYGPRMALDDGRVVSNFIVQALKNQPITIYGDGKQTRSFQYIDDLILGMVKMMEKDNFIGPVNLGNPKEITIKKLALKIVKLTKSKSKFVFKPLPIDDPRRRKPDISLAKKKLGWYPKINLETGLRKTIDYFKEELALK